MKRVERLGQAIAPDGTVLVLHRHDGAYSIRVDGVELMSTRRHHSEERLAEVACLPLGDTPNARVLVGGLGLGFTLRAALRSLRTDAFVLVVELVPAVIEWNLNPEYDLARDSLRDTRVELRQADVGAVLRTSIGQFDAIMLDVDNGAEPLTSAGNSDLYGDSGIHIAAAALRRSGCLAYWSATSDPSFVRALRRSGLTVETITASASPASRRNHVIHLARRDGVA